MNNAAIHGALGKLKMEHRNFGLMIGELEVAVQTMEGDALVNAIDDISLRYNFPVA
jgi:hypothetical protein